MVVDGAGLEDLDPLESLAFDPHNGAAGATVVVGDLLARVAGTCEGAVSAGELFELRCSDEVVSVWRRLEF